MARATKERIQRDAVRFGLGRGISSPAAETARGPHDPPGSCAFTSSGVCVNHPPKPGKHDATPCVSCGRPLGQHTRTEIHNCAMERS